MLIKNSNLVKQSIDFSGIKSGKIHPSDIDAVLEFDNEALILMEIKLIGATFPVGQKLMLERICDSWHTDKSIILFINHTHTDELTDIPLNKSNVTAVYSKGKWTSKNIKVKECITKLLEHWGIEKWKDD